MKVGISITLISLLVTGMLHISVANHYCSGNLAATRISVSGKLASCGMEISDTRSPKPGSMITGHCCDDVIVSLVTENNFVPSFNINPVNNQHKIQITDISLFCSVLSPIHKKSYITNVLPPGRKQPTYTDCSEICVFRI